jgi:hypothetical protein
LLRGILDEHSRSIQSTQITRRRNYATGTYFDITPPENLPNWAYYFEGETKESAEKHKKRKVTEYEESMYSEEQQTGESALMGEVRGAIAKAKSAEGTKIAKKKTTQKKGKEAATSSKFRRSPRLKSIKGKEKEVEEEEEEESEEESENNE